ncbi:MAG: T9SS type A sorting domain-containing protein [Bacteroidetes bacterium]|nr:T9SS type A sorting domain-containing protein [Bacteroidota bacterium]
MKNKLIASLALFCFLFSEGWGQNPSGNTKPPNGPWKDIPQISLPKTGRDAPLPEKYRLLELDVEQMGRELAQVPLDFSKDADKPAIEISLPLPDGSYEKFRIYNDPIMHPDLAQKYPEIQTFAGQGVDDPAIMVRLDFTPHGFNAQILSSKRNSIYIAPVASGDNRHHISYFKKDSKRTEAWECKTQGLGHGFDFPSTPAENLVDGCGTRREYRLALACTSEYATFHGGTVPLVMAAMVTTMNRVNGVYSGELSIRMNIVANNNLLISLAEPDPYTNNDGTTMLGENQANCDAVIGSANYDIGHVFSTGGGGIAGPGPCNNASKATGVTGSGSPIGDAFDIDYVAHEMGHQFSANHTFNEDNVTNCDATNVSPGQAFEPGSGSTIMAYAGICNPVDVQSNSDDYFHAISLQEIAIYVTVGTGSTCGTNLAVANNQPTANAGADFTIPASTPFKLTATASDPDGNPITYCWEQMDNQLINHPPASTVTNGPVFRSLDPSTSPTRFFPALPTILSGALSSTWEVLPSVARTLNFRVTTRDNIPAGGCTEEDDMVVTVVGTAGPFSVNPVTGPGANCLLAEDNATISWNVANTTAPPVNTANVDILLSLDGGNNFTILLADDTPNDGSQSVAIPANAITTQGRIMVMASNNIFFDINDADIRIDCPINRTVTDNPASGTYKVRQRLETSGNVVVLSGTSARFFAGEEIALLPGFRAQAGSDFLARIQPCDPCVANKPLGLLAQIENPKVIFYEVPTNQRASESALTERTAPSFQLFPNPATNEVNLRFLLDRPMTVSAVLLSALGKKVGQIQPEQILPEGEHLFSIPVSQYSPGTYFVTYQLGDKRVVEKLVLIGSW